jgi:hypothetical protein
MFEANPRSHADTSINVVRNSSQGRRLRRFVGLRS